MKDLSKLSILLLFILFSFTFELAPQNLIIKPVWSGYLNVTATFITENVYQKSKYIYFYYDFDFNHKMYKAKSDIAYFLLTTKSQYFPNAALGKTVSQFFTDKDPKELKSSDLEKAKWEQSNLVYKYKVNNYNNFTKYYLKITRSSKDKNKPNLVLRIPILNRQGAITIENLLKLSPSAEKANNIKQNIVRNLLEPFKRTNLNFSTSSHRMHNRSKFFHRRPFLGGYRNGINFSINFKNAYNYSYDVYSYSFNGRLLLGAALFFVWGILFVGYFLVSRKNKIRVGTIKIGENNLPTYMNI